MDEARGSGPFPDTSWTLISRIRSADPGIAQRALGEACELYRYPLYCFLRRRGLDHTDAEDVLHDFIAKFLRNDSFQRADEDKGRLRGYLARSLDRFLLNWRDKLSRDPLSGSIPLAPRNLQSRYSTETQSSDETPDHFLERKWAVEILHLAVNRLHQTYLQRGRAHVFTKLRPLLLAGGSLRGEDTARIAGELSMSGETLRVAFHRFLGEFRQELKNEILQTLENPSELDDEIRFLSGLFGKK